MTREEITNNYLIDSLNGIIAGFKDDPKSLVALGLFIKDLEYIKEKIEKGEWSCESDTCKENHEACTREDEHVKVFIKENFEPVEDKCKAESEVQDD